MYYGVSQEFQIWKGQVGLSALERAKADLIVKLIALRWSDAGQIRMLALQQAQGVYAHPLVGQQSVAYSQHECAVL